METLDLPYTFPVDARWRPQALQIAQTVGPVVEPDLDRIVGLSIVEFRPR